MSDVKRSDSKDWEDKNVKKKSTSKYSLADVFPLPGMMKRD